MASPQELSYKGQTLLAHRGMTIAQAYVKLKAKEIPGYLPIAIQLSGKTAFSRILAVDLYNYKSKKYERIALTRATTGKLFNVAVSYKVGDRFKIRVDFDHPEDEVWSAIGVIGGEDFDVKNVKSNQAYVVTGVLGKTRVRANSINFGIIRERLEQQGTPVDAMDPYDASHGDPIFPGELARAKAMGGRVKRAVRDNNFYTQTKSLITSADARSSFKENKVKDGLTLGLQFLAIGLGVISVKRVLD